VANTFTGFKAELDKEFSNVKEAISERYKQHALDFLEYVTSEPPRGTPILTGYTSNSWHVSINDPTRNSVGEPSTFIGASVAQARQNDSITELKSIKDMTEIRSIFICNNNPWIEDLDGGSSTQNPGNFIEMGKQYSESRE